MWLRPLVIVPRMVPNEPNPMGNQPRNIGRDRASWSGRSTRRLGRRGNEISGVVDLKDSFQVLTDAIVAVNGEKQTRSDSETREESQLAAGGSVEASIGRVSESAAETWNGRPCASLQRRGRTAPHHWWQRRSQAKRSKQWGAPCLM